MKKKLEADGPVTLGEKYTDVITGFSGVATSRTEYLYGCVHVSLEGEASGERAPILTVDEQRLITTATGKVPAPTATSGGPNPRGVVPRRG